MSKDLFFLKEIRQYLDDGEVCHVEQMLHDWIDELEENVSDGWMPIETVEQSEEQRVLVWTELHALGPDQFIGSFGDDGSWCIDGWLLESAEKAGITHWQPLCKKPVSTLKQGGAK